MMNSTKNQYNKNNDEQIYREMQHQIEYYFSPENLSRDAYMNQVLMTHQGAAPVPVIASFPRMQMLLKSLRNPMGTEVDCVIHSLDHSRFLTVSPNRAFIHVAHPPSPQPRFSPVSFSPDLHKDMGRTASTSTSPTTFATTETGNSNYYDEGATRYGYTETTNHYDANHYEGTAGHYQDEGNHFSESTHRPYFATYPPDYGNHGMVDRPVASRRVVPAPASYASVASPYQHHQQQQPPLRPMQTVQMGQPIQSVQPVQPMQSVQPVYYSVPVGVPIQHGIVANTPILPQQQGTAVPQMHQHLYSPQALDMNGAPMIWGSPIQDQSTISSSGYPHDIYLQDNAAPNAQNISGLEDAKEWVEPNETTRKNQYRKGGGGKKKKKHGKKAPKDAESTEETTKPDSKDNAPTKNTPAKSTKTKSDKGKNKGKKKTVNLSEELAQLKIKE